MRIFNELRYPSSNLSEIFTQRMFQASFEKIWKIFFELSRGQAWSYRRTDRQTDRQTDGQTDRQTDRRTDAGNDNTPPALGPRGKKVCLYGKKANISNSCYKGESFFYTPFKFYQYCNIIYTLSKLIPLLLTQPKFGTFKHEQYSCHLTDDILECLYLKDNICSLTQFYWSVFQVFRIMLCAKQIEWIKKSLYDNNCNRCNIFGKYIFIHAMCLYVYLLYNSYKDISYEYTHTIIIWGSVSPEAIAIPSMVKWFCQLPPVYSLTKTELENSIKQNMFFDNLMIKINNKHPTYLALTNALKYAD